MTHPRMRVTAIIGSSVLALSLAAPVATAQDDPAAPVNEVLTAFAEGRYGEAAASFCTEMEAEALGGLGQISEFAPSGLGFDLGQLFGALTVDVDDLAVSVLEESGDDALVGIEGTIEVGFDEDGLIALMATMMSSEEAPLDEEAIRGMLPMLMPQIEAMVGGSVEVDEDVAIIREDGVWQVCDDLSSLSDALGSAMGASAAGPADDMPNDDLEDEEVDDGE